MKYALAILSHGKAETLGPAVVSFVWNVSPTNAQMIVHYDRDSEGFCIATSRLWQKCVESDVDYVFWLEHDFEFVRPVDLTELAEVLDADRMLSQVSLMRDAVSRQEKAAGGLFELRDGVTAWERHSWGYVQSDYVMTTNPSLMRRSFMVENPWPTVWPEFCEGHFGVDLRSAGYRGGVWDDGSVYVRHLGQRDGSGHGY